ncbi:hypothetical protein ACQPZX_42260 [Actinoplanes sp. CA-142083]|uniref:hypothetical protein n=1 Tax=Actinoplanes sp. CA-142083 TaxID=3239903 RepID=UPI003D8C3806
MPMTDRPRRWWRLVIVGSLLYVVLVASNYYSPWLGDSPLVWVSAEILLVALAVFAAVKDLSAVPLRGVERAALVVAAVIVLLWVPAALLTWFASGRRDDVLSLLLGLLVAIPVLPLAALALPGTIAYRHARRA